MANLIILAGVPGCGKSTWAKQFFDLKYVVISSDAIRVRLLGSQSSEVAHSPEKKAENNAKVFNEFHQVIERNLTNNVDTIADATNLNRFARQKLIDIAERVKSVDIQLVLFKNVLEATARNAERPDETRVPEEAMRYMVQKYYDTLAELPQERPHYASVTKVESYA